MSSPVETKRIRDHLQIEEPVAELPVVTADDNGDVLTVVEGAWAKSAPSGGGGLLVETTFVDVSEYVKGFKSNISADDIIDAIKSGNSVVVHLPKKEECSVFNDTWASLVCYQPAIAGEYPVAEVFEFASPASGNTVLNWLTTPVRTEDGKVLFPIYID